MELTHIFAFNLALFAAMISPGPAFLVVVQNTLSSGRKAGCATGAGLAIVAALWTAAALLGLDVVFTLFPWAYVAVKTVGALYLLYIAFSTWRGARNAIQAKVKPARYAFRQGLMVNALNPKSMLFAAAVLVVIFPSNMTLWENAFVVVNHLIFEMIFYASLAFLMSRETVSKGYSAAKMYVDRLSAVILCVLGGRLLFTR